MHTDPQIWTTAEQYICEHFVPLDAALDSAITRSDAAELPSIQVSPNQGQLLSLLIQLVSAQRVLEIGTLGGYSTIWMARAMPSTGRLLTLEFEPRHAEVARQNIAEAGLSDRVEIRVGAALETLPHVAAETSEPFDLVFIDADKQSTAEYFDWAVRLTRPGGLVIVDNVVRKGTVVDANTTDDSVQGVRRFYEQAGQDPRVQLTALQTVGSKGYDGLAIARVLPPAGGPVPAQISN
ncbi:MAG: O-methyltransferase [Planctomycetaceae bacterium]